MRRAASVFVLCLLVLGVRRPVSALARSTLIHATLISSEPAANSHLATTPARVRLLFSERIESAMTQLTIVAEDGALTKLAASGDPHDVRAVIAPTDALAAGAYRVVWRVVSADGHPVEGTFAFWVGAATEAAPDSVAAMASPVTMGPTIVGAPAVASLLRGAGMASLLGLTGFLFFAAWAKADITGGAGRLATVLAIAAVVLLGAHLAVWMMNAAPDHSLSGDSTAEIMGSTVGRIELWRVGLVLIAAWALLLARRHGLALVFAGAAVIVSGATGHSAAIQPLLAVPARAVHLIAGASWLGGLLWLTTRDGRASATFAREAHRVSQTALVAVVLVGVTGVAQALLFLPSVMDVFHSAYGAVLLGKIGGFALLIGFGAFHRYRVMPRIDEENVRGRFAGTLRGEIAVMTAVLLLSGLLAYISPPHEMSEHDHMTMEHASTR